MFVADGCTVLISASCNLQLVAPRDVRLNVAVSALAPLGADARLVADILDPEQNRIHHYKRDTFDYFGI